MLAPEPPLTPPKALPEEDRLGEVPDRDGDAAGEGLCRLVLGEAVGRLAEGEPVDGRAAGVPVEGRAPAVPVEGRVAPVEPQPRDSMLRAEVVAPGDPLLLSRLESGCHFLGVPVAEVPAARV